jgi:hypothetical protein
MACNDTFKDVNVPGEETSGYKTSGAAATYAKEYIQAAALNAFRETGANCSADCEDKTQRCRPTISPTDLYGPAGLGNWTVFAYLEEGSAKTMYGVTIPGCTVKVTCNCRPIHWY